MLGGHRPPLQAQEGRANHEVRSWPVLESSRYGLCAHQQEPLAGGSRQRARRGARASCGAGAPVLMLTLLRRAHNWALRVCHTKCMHQRVCVVNEHNRGGGAAVDDNAAVKINPGTYIDTGTISLRLGHAEPCSHPCSCQCTHAHIPETTHLRLCRLCITDGFARVSMKLRI